MAICRDQHFLSMKALSPTATQSTHSQPIVRDFPTYSWYRGDVFFAKRNILVATQILSSGFKSRMRDTRAEPPRAGTERCLASRVAVMPAIPEPRLRNRKRVATSALLWAAHLRLSFPTFEARRRNLAVRSSPTGVWRSLIASFLMGVGESDHVWRAAQRMCLE
jgi:hypothetical protein